jgi:hypothetical protein
MSSSKPAKTTRRRPTAIRPTAKSGGEAETATDLSAQAVRLAAEVERGIAGGHPDILAPEAVQALMAAVCRSYTAQVEAGNPFAALAPRSSATSTDVMTTASGLLRAANLAVFELGMWQSWTGR